MVEKVPLPVFDFVLCTGCGECVLVCPEQVLVMAAGRPHLLPDVNCEYCGECEEICPTGAVSLSYEIVFGGV